MSRPRTCIIIHLVCEYAFNVYFIYIFFSRLVISLFCICFHPYSFYFSCILKYAAYYFNPSSIDVRCSTFISFNSISNISCNTKIHTFRRFFFAQFYQWFHSYCASVQRAQCLSRYKSITIGVCLYIDPLLVVD